MMVGGWAEDRETVEMDPGADQGAVVGGGEGGSPAPPPSFADTMAPKAINSRPRYLRARCLVSTPPLSPWPHSSRSGRLPTSSQPSVAARWPLRQLPQQLQARLDLGLELDRVQGSVKGLQFGPLAILQKLGLQQSLVGGPGCIVVLDHLGPHPLLGDDLASGSEEVGVEAEGR